MRITEVWVDQPTEFLVSEVRIECSIYQGLASLLFHVLDIVPQTSVQDVFGKIMSHIIDRFDLRLDKVECLRANIVVR